MTKINVASYLAALCLLAVMAGCSERQGGANAPKVIPVRVMEIVDADAVLEHNYVGTVEESYSQLLSFSSPGSVEQVLVSEGQEVQKGQLLAVLGGETMRNSHEASLATLKQAQDAYDRIFKLHMNGSIPDIKFIEVETALQQAKSMEAVMRKSLEDCKLYAPRNGIIVQRSIEVGDNVFPNVQAFRIISIDRVDVKVAVPENEIGGISVGQRASVTVPALNNSVFVGTIDRKGVTANKLSHTYEIRIGIDNRQLALMPGMVGKVAVQRESGNRHIVIPVRVVQITHDGERFVWIDDNSVARRRFVETGSFAGDGIIIEKGLEAGNRIIIDGHHKVSEGMMIAVTQ